MKIFQLGVFLFLIACSTMNQSLQHSKLYTFRLKPGTDLKKSLLSFANEHHLKAASIVTAVGSLTEYNLRFANKKDGNKKSGHFEIVSLVGTVTENGGHIHLAVSDEKGATIGGHLLEGNIIYTTCEITLVEDLQSEFIRETDDTYGFQELKVIPRK
jgi:predicted DNA-binding protein with PD1-like motif